MVDLLDAADRSSWPSDARVVTHSSDRRSVERIRLRSQPQKEPGLVARLFGQAMKRSIGRQTLIRIV